MYNMMYALNKNLHTLFYNHSETKLTDFTQVIKNAVR